jgi:hypothetical protein
MAIVNKNHSPGFAVVTIEIGSDVLHYFWCNNVTMLVFSTSYNLISWSNLKAIKVDFKIIKSCFA